MKKVVFLLCCICVLVACGPKQEDAATYYNRGLVKDSAQDYKGARAEYEKAAILYPAFAKAYYREGLDDAHEHDTAKAMYDLHLAIKADASYVQAQEMMGKLETSRKNYSVALAEYDSVAARFRNYKGIYHDILETKELMKDYNGALALEGKLAREDPFDTFALHHKLNLEIQLGMDDSALNDAAKLADKAYFDADIHNVEGVLKFKQGDYTGAYEAADMAVLMSKSSVPNYFVNRGTALRYLGKYGSAKRDEYSALDLDPKFEPAWKELGYIASAQHKYKDALGYYNHALLYGSNDVELYYCEALVYDKLGDYTNEITNCDKVLSFRPTARTAETVRICGQMKRHAQAKQRAKAGAHRKTKNRK